MLHPPCTQRVVLVLSLRSARTALSSLRYSCARRMLMLWWPAFPVRASVTSFGHEQYVPPAISAFHDDDEGQSESGDADASMQSITSLPPSRAPTSSQPPPAAAYQSIANDASAGSLSPGTILAVHSQGSRLFFCNYSRMHGVSVPAWQTWFQLMPVFLERLCLWAIAPCVYVH